MDPKSILLIGNHFKKRNGFSYIVDELVDHLNKNGWRTYTASKYKNKVLRLLEMVFAIITLSPNYQVAEVDVFSGPAFTWAEVSTRLLHFLNKPVILTLHGGNLPVFSDKHSQRVKNVLAQATKVITPSEYLKERLGSYRADIQIIPNPIELKCYPFHPRKIAAPKLIWLRAFHEIYNPSLAVWVLYELRDLYMDLSLTMVGPDKADGSLKKLHDLAEELKIRDKLLLPGAIPRAQVPDWLNRNDIFINTTSIDNTPVSVIEAMACGLCIVSTNVGGIPYLLEDGVDALLVPPNDACAMAKAVNMILANPILADKLSTNARRKAEKFSWDVVFPTWESLFKEAMEIS